MALTRRTPCFRELAAAADAHLALLGVSGVEAVVDAALNQRVEQSGELIGVQPRTALRYAPDHVAQWIAEDVLEALQLLEQERDHTVLDLATRRQPR